MKLKILLFWVLFPLKMNAQVVGDVAQYVPLATAVGLDFCGVEAKHPLRERICLAATAFTTLTATAGALKLTVSERRPDGSDYRSFPSGHAARAFAGAEMVRSEYGWAWGLGAYALATGVGILRITGDHHYTHDVLAGAAIGVASTRLAYWLLPVERRLLGWESKEVSIGAVPTYSPASQSVGFALTMTFH